jgi:hypothetical protein
MRPIGNTDGRTDCPQPWSDSLIPSSIHEFFSAVILRIG